MKILGKAEIAEVKDAKTLDVLVPEWGEDVGVKIKSLTVAEHKAFANAVKDIQDDATISAHLCVACLVDESGLPLFAMSDVSALVGKSASAVKGIAKHCMTLNGLGKGQEDERKNG
jgi:hypothetical protein